MKKIFTIFLSLVLILGLSASYLSGSVPHTSAKTLASQTFAKANSVYFVKNVGQADKSVEYYAYLKDGIAFFGKGFFGFSTRKNGKRFVYRVYVDGKPESSIPLKTQISYMINRSKYLRAPAFGKIFYDCGNYSLAFFSKDGKLEWNIVSKNISSVKLRYDPGKNGRLKAYGNVLKISWPDGSITEKTASSFSYGRKVSVNYKVLDGNVVTFESAAKSVLIDPATYLGGEGEDVAYTEFVTDKGVYVGGYTNSPHFPTVPGSYDENYGGNQDGFVSLLSSDLSTLIASTFIGGSGEDGVNKITVSNGTVYIAGYTKSTPQSFPVTSNAYQAQNRGGEDVFVAELSSDLSELKYATYLGGSANDRPYAIAVYNNSVYIAGGTYSADFPTTNGAYDRTSEAVSTNQYKLDGFVSKLSEDLSTLEASTFLEGSSYDVIYALGIYDNSVYVAGYTYSSNFPVVNAYQPSNNGAFDAFVSKLNLNLTQLEASTYLGGSSYEFAYDLAFGSDGVYVAGGTFSGNFPVTSNALQKTYGGASSSWSYGGDGFISELSFDLNTLKNSTYLGGSADDSVSAIKVEGNKVFAAGDTKSGNFPINGDTFDKTYNGEGDGFIAVVSNDLSNLELSTYFGGTKQDNSGAIFIKDSYVYVAGNTYSTDFPVTNGAYDTDYNGGATTPNAWGGGDAFVLKLTDLLTEPQPILRISKTGPGNATSGSVAMYKITIKNTGNGTAYNTILTDYLPAGEHFISGTPAPDSVTVNAYGTKVVWNVGSFDPDKTLVFTYKVSVPLVMSGCMSFTNRAVLTADNADKAETSFSTLVCATNPPPKPNPPKPNPINITINPPEKICINSESKFVFTFTGGVPPYDYKISFGDGTDEITGKESGKFITLLHTFAKAGLYTVSIEVTDSKGTTSVLTRSVEAKDCRVVLLVYHQNFIIGYPDGLFRPEKMVTRAEVATMLSRALGFNANVLNHISPFKDVSAGKWYFRFVKTINIEKLMKGRSQYDFYPNAPATRAEVAAILVRIRGLKPEEPQEQLFTDVKPTDWFNGYIYTAVKAGLLQGYKDHTFRPNKPVTRAEFVTLLSRALYREDVPQAENLKNLPKVPFTDVSASYWAYRYIIEAAVPHIVTNALRAPINLILPTKTIPVYLASTKSEIKFPKIGVPEKVIVPVDGLQDGKDPTPRKVIVRIINTGTP